MVAILSLGFVAGVWLTQFLSYTQFAHIVWLLVGLMLCIGTFVIRRAYIGVPMIVLGGLVIGLWYSAPSYFNKKVVDNLTGSKVEVIGRVSDDPKHGSDSRVSFKINTISIDNNKIDGELWVSEVRQEDTIKRSNTVLLTGKIDKGFGGYIGNLTEASVVEVIESSSKDYGLQVRDNFSNFVRLAMPEPESSLGLGFLVGQQSDLPVDLLEALKIVGLTHVIVASGYNLTILVRFARKLFSRISKYLAAVMSIAMIFGFITITGWSPSMTRAAIVATISLAAWYYGRKIHPVVLLSITAAITLLIRPSYVWGDLGWSLSFASFVGILILAPYLRAYFFGDNKDNWLIRIIIETSSAYLLTLPLIALTIGKLSLVAIFANLLVVPLVPLVMALTFISGVLAIVSIWLGQLVGWIGYQLIHYIIWISSYLASFSWSSIELNFSVGLGVIWYIAIVILCLYLRKVTRIKLVDTNVVV